METVFIDGAAGEGGGQILRTAVALAAITGKPTEISRIRARRSKPGLQAQHLTAVRAAGELCVAELHGAELGSSFLRFVPTSKVQAGNFVFDVAGARAGGSAGATSLVLQTVALPLGLVTTTDTPATVTLKGGTHVPMSPSADFIERVYRSQLTEMGMTTHFINERAGFFPTGGGTLWLSVAGSLSQGIDRTERGKLKKLYAVVTTSELPDTVAERGVATLQKELKGYGVPVLPVIRRLPSSCAGAAVLLVAECERSVNGWQSLGERGKPMEQVALEAVRAFVRWHPTGFGTEGHLADQLALPAALAATFAGATSQWTTDSVSEHLRTVLAVIGQYLPCRITLQENESGSGQVAVELE